MNSINFNNKGLLVADGTPSKLPPVATGETASPNCNTNIHINGDGQIGTLTVNGGCSNHSTTENNGGNTTNPKAIEQNTPANPADPAPIISPNSSEQNQEIDPYKQLSNDLFSSVDINNCAGCLPSALWTEPPLSDGEVSLTDIKQAERNFETAVLKNSEEDIPK